MGGVIARATICFLIELRVETRVVLSAVVVVFATVVEEVMVPMLVLFVAVAFATSLSFLTPEASTTTASAPVAAAAAATAAVATSCSAFSFAASISAASAAFTTSSAVIVIVVIVVVVVVIDGSPTAGPEISVAFKDANETAHHDEGAFTISTSSSSFCSPSTGSEVVGGTVGDAAVVSPGDGVDGIDS